MDIMRFFGMRRKGITPVIAIVLLLMMTVAAAGMAYVWIMSVQQGLEDDTEASIRDIQVQQNMKLSIASVYNNSGKVSFIVKNSGSYVFTSDDAAGISAYANGQLITAGNCGSSIRARGTTCTVDTNVNFPNKPGGENAVIVKIEPPAGVGDTHSCTVPQASSLYSTC